jgi:hypothetical protein
MYDLKEIIMATVAAMIIGLLIGAVGTYASADTNTYHKAIETNSNNWNNANQCIQLLEEIKDYTEYTNELLRGEGLVRGR